jgi:hypothetical protein
MFVTLAKYKALLRRCERETAAREAAERKLDEKDAALLKMQGLVQHQRDQYPTAPLPYPQAPVGDAELRRQLALAKRALAETVDRCVALQDANVSLTEELRAQREGATA